MGLTVRRLMLCFVGVVFLVRGNAGQNGRNWNGNNGNDVNGNDFNGNNGNGGNGNVFNGNNGNGGNGNFGNGNNGCRTGWILTADSAKTPSCVEPNNGNANGNGNGNAYSNGHGNDNSNGNSNWKRIPSWCCPPPVTPAPSKKMICPVNFWWSENGKGKNCYPLTGYCCC